MSVEVELKKIILARYKSLRAFTIAIDVPYSTIDTMLKKGLNGASVSTVMKVCNELSISAEGVTKGIIEPAQGESAYMDGAYFMSPSKLEKRICREVSAFKETLVSINPYAIGRRQEKYLSVSGIAKTLNTSTSFIDELESGKPVQVSAATLQAYASAIDTSLEVLLSNIKRERVDFRTPPSVFDGNEDGAGSFSPSEYSDEQLEYLELHGLVDYGGYDSIEDATWDEDVDDSIPSKEESDILLKAKNPGDVLKLLRQARTESVEFLARQVNVTPEDWRMWEKNKNFPSDASTLNVIAGCLDFDPELFYHYDFVNRYPFENKRKPLTEEELWLIDNLRKLDHRGMRTIRNLIDSELRNVL